MKNEAMIDLFNLVNIDASRDPGWAFPLHSHDRQLELSLVTDGKVTLYYDGRSFEMKRGDIAVKNAGVVHAEKSSRTEPVKQICISFSGVEEREGEVGRLTEEFEEPVFATGNYYDYLKGAFEFLRNTEGSEEMKSRRRHTIMSILDVVSVICKKDSKATGRIRENSKRSETVERVIEWINRNYSKKITLEDLSARFYISPFHLERKFKELTGYSVNRYVTDRRMGEAERMLIFDDMSIKDVAVSVGYSNIQYFYTVFKKTTGLTPIEFQNRYR